MSPLTPPTKDDPRDTAMYHAFRAYIELDQLEDEEEVSSTELAIAHALTAIAIHLVAPQEVV